MYPLSSQTLENEIRNLEIIQISTATIRQIAGLATRLEQLAGEEIVHMEMGNPGLPAPAIGVEAQCNALRSGVANVYPNIVGIPQIKEGGERFLKAFLDVEVPARCIVPTVGSMQGSFTTILLLNQRDTTRDTMLYINPGFPAQRHQAKVLGMKQVSFDILDYRGDKLETKLRSILQTGKITALIYSNPNNPAWTNLTDHELEIIGRLSMEYDVTVIEDLAYMGMDFRRDLSHPGEAPFIPSVAKYTDNYILLLSASKIFSYAGERIALVCISPAVFDRRNKFFEEFYEMPTYGEAYIFGVLYVCSSGTSHAAQHAMAAMLNAAADGSLNFVDDCREYGRRAARAKELFLSNGFNLVYADDEGTPISDGFFFTVTYPGMDSETLQKELMRYGVSTISLPGTGSEHEGLRICVSKLDTEEIYQSLAQRLTNFHNDH